MGALKDPNWLIDVAFSGRAIYIYKLRPMFCGWGHEDGPTYLSTHGDQLFTLDRIARISEDQPTAPSRSSSATALNARLMFSPSASASSLTYTELCSSK